MNGSIVILFEETLKGENGILSFIIVKMDAQRTQMFGVK